MNFKLISIGKFPKNSPYLKIFEEYRKRIRYKVELIEIRNEEEKIKDFNLQRSIITRNTNSQKENAINSVKDKKKVLAPTAETVGSVQNERAPISDGSNHSNNNVSTTSAPPAIIDKKVIAEIVDAGVRDKENAALIASPDVSRQNIVKTIDTTKENTVSPATKSKKARTKGRTPDGKKDRHRRRKKA